MEPVVHHPLLWAESEPQKLAPWCVLPLISPHGLFWLTQKKPLIQKMRERCLGGVYVLEKENVFFKNFRCSKIILFAGLFWKCCETEKCVSTILSFLILQLS